MASRWLVAGYGFLVAVPQGPAATAVLARQAPEQALANAAADYAAIKGLGQVCSERRCARLRRYQDVAAWPQPATLPGTLLSGVYLQGLHITTATNGAALESSIEPRHGGSIFRSPVYRIPFTGGAPLMKSKLLKRKSCSQTHQSDEVLDE
jgi:hypothetical protein